MMKKTIYLITILFASVTIAYAEPLYKCADDNGIICSDVTKKTGPYVPDPNNPQRAEIKACHAKCTTQKNGIQNTMNSSHANGGIWACTLTGSEVIGTRPDDGHSGPTIFCECSITCVKGQVIEEEL